MLSTARTRPGAFRPGASHPGAHGGAHSQGRCADPDRIPRRGQVLAGLCRPGTRTPSRMRTDRPLPRRQFRAFVRGRGARPARCAALDAGRPLGKAKSARAAAAAASAPPIPTESARSGTGRSPGAPDGRPGARGAPRPTRLCGRSPVDLAPGARRRSATRQRCAFAGSHSPLRTESPFCGACDKVCRLVQPKADVVASRLIAAVVLPFKAE